MLSDKKVRQAQPTDKEYKLSDERGLYLIVSPRGGKWWRLRYRYANKERMLSLGTYPDVGLRRAREKRDEARALLADGIDPSAQRKAAKTATADTFQQIAEEWLKTQEKTLTDGTLVIARRRLQMWVYPQIGERPIKSLEPPEVLELLRKIEMAGEHETAHRVRQRIGQVCRYAIVTGRAERDPTADLKGALMPVPTKNRSAITEPKKVGQLMRAIDCYSGQLTTRLALSMLALTFLRPGELRRAIWDEIDMENAMWRVPAARMKMRREHLVPLSEQALKILKELNPITGKRPYVFESLRPKRPLSENTINVALRTMGYSGDEMTAHGFRAMASTLLHEHQWAPEIIELQLAHAQRSQVAAAYNRSARLQERKEMMQAWADYLDELRKV